MHDSVETHSNQNNQRGNSLFLVAASLFVLLGISALAIDLAKMYVTRNEAQRAADAAALAGAKTFIDSGFTSGLISEGAARTIARAEAISVGAENTVSGDPALILDSDVSFNFASQGNPQISVFVQRVKARNNAVPTFFAKAVGINEVDVGAVATAEAYNPSGNDGVPIGVSCIKPWILPNCDPDPAHGGSATECLVPFVDTANDGEIVNKGAYPAGSIGQPFLVKPGDPKEAAAPSQFYPIQIPSGGTTLCPDCAGSGGGSGGPGAALYRQNIECCNTFTLACGDTVNLNLQVGNMVGPTRMGVECLIHQDRSGSGQDILDTSSLPFDIMGGDNNPNPLLQGQRISDSDSIISVPIYDGQALTPGVGQAGSVTVIGFLQLFIDRTEKGNQGNVRTTILNIAGCGTGTAGDSTGGSGETSIRPPTIDAGGSLFPVRLIRPSG